jgi:hypothetical protein
MSNQADQIFELPANFEQEIKAAFPKMSQKEIDRLRVDIESGRITFSKEEATGRIGLLFKAGSQVPPTVIRGSISITHPPCDTSIPAEESHQEPTQALALIEAPSPIPPQSQVITTPEQSEKSVETFSPSTDSHIVNDESPVLAPFSTIEGRNWMAERVLATEGNKIKTLTGKLIKFDQWAKLMGYSSITKEVRREFDKVRLDFARNNQQTPILLLGDGPFEARELAEFLHRFDFPVYLEHLSPPTKSSDKAWKEWRCFGSVYTPLVIVGKKNFASRGFLSLLVSQAVRDECSTPSTLIYRNWIERVAENNGRCHYLRSRSLATVTFISQEMLLAEIFTKGNGSFNFETAWKKHSESHPALKSVRSINEDIKLLDEAFQWPNTEAEHGETALGPTDWPQVGMLGFLGYSVGQNGELRTTRQRILRDLLYKVDLPKVENQAYVAEWGAPESGARLRKMAQSIASFCRGARRRDEFAMSVAIEEWEEDLAWLKKTYYDGRFDRQFTWPDTKQY